MNEILKYRLGQEIYHKSPDSDKGIIVDITYSYRTKLHSYLVSIGIDKSGWCDELELSVDKVFKNKYK